MKTSLVMAIYNGEKYIYKQLESIRLQTQGVDEVILVDDCSTDESLNIVNSYISTYHLDHWKVMENDKNLGYLLNFKKGLSYVTGDIIFLCDQDDYWHKDKVEKMVHYLKDEKIYSLASSFRFMNAKDEIFEVETQKGKANHNLLNMEIKNKLTEVSFKYLLRMNFSQGCTMAIKKEIVNDFLKIEDTSLPHDWTINMISASKNGAYYLDEALIDYRIHDQNTIGLDSVVNSGNEKSKRVNQRIELTELEKNNADYALRNIDLNDDLKSLAMRFQSYLTYRINCMENKYFMKLVVYFMKGKYKEFGEFKTFMGDILNILKRN